MPHLGTDVRYAYGHSSTRGYLGAILWEGEAPATPGSVPQTNLRSPSPNDDYWDGFSLHTTPVLMQLTTKNSRDPDFPGQALLSEITWTRFLVNHLESCDALSCEEVGITLVVVGSHGTRCSLTAPLDASERRARLSYN